MILHGIEYQRPTSLNMRILADHVTYSFLAFMKSIFHFYPAALKAPGYCRTPSGRAGGRAGGRQGRQAPLTLSRP